MTALREFSGYKVSDSFVAEVNTREKGKFEVNLQEIMAARLDMGVAFYISGKRNDVCQEFGIGYNHIEAIRESANWYTAKEEFVDQNSLTDPVLTSYLAPKSTNGNSSNGTAKKSKLSVLRAKEIGFAIWNVLPQEVQEYVGNATEEHIDNVVATAGMVGLRQAHIAHCYIANAGERAKAKAEQEKVEQARIDTTNAKIAAMVKMGVSEEHVKVMLMVNDTDLSGTTLDDSISEDTRALDLEESIEDIEEHEACIIENESDAIDTIKDVIG